VIGSNVPSGARDTIDALRRVLLADVDEGSFPYLRVSVAQVQLEAVHHTVGMNLLA
jgi:hypothetical protein